MSEWLGGICNKTLVQEASTFAAMASADGMTLKTMVMNFLESKTQAEVESMTIKAVRRGVSDMFHLTLDDKQKRKVQQYIMEFFEKQEVKVTSAQAAPSRKKKASEISAVAAVGDAEADSATVVAATVDPDGEPAKKAMKSEPTCWVRTSSGAVAPKFLKKAQARAMKTKTFLANAG